MVTGYTQHFGHSVWKWVQNTMPGLRGTPCAPIEFEQHAGEVLFIPFGWHHAVLNMEPVVGVAQQLGMPNDLSLAFRNI